MNAAKAEAVAGCEFKVYGSLMHMMALASVIGRPIYLVYPNVAFRYRVLMQNLLKPRLPAVNDDPVCLLWSRDGNLDSRPNSWYQPNHFAVLTSWESDISCGPPIQVSSDIDSQSASLDRNEKPRKSSSSKQGSILSFVSSLHIPPKPQKGSKKKGQHQSQKGEKRTAKCAEIEVEEKHPSKRSISPVSKRKFLPQWKEEFPWVLYHEDRNVMTCEICGGAPLTAGKTDFLTGSRTFKKETLTKHNATGGHLLARDAVLAKQQPLVSAPIAQSFRKGEKVLEEQTRNEFAAKINTAYLVAKEELPFSKFGPILELQKKNGLDINQTYANDKSCSTPVSFIGAVFTEKLANEVKGKAYLSLLIDRATNASGKENETVHCRFIEDGKPVNRLVGHKTVAYGHAEGISSFFIAVSFVLI